LLLINLVGSIFMITLETLMSQNLFESSVRSYKPLIFYREMFAKALCSAEL
jgi:hypothetical protein